MKELSPLEAFEQALRNWWLIVLVAIWGAAVGWMIHSLRPPLYEAQAVYTVTLDFNQTGRLTQFEEDHAWNTVGGLLASTSVLEQVVQQASSQGIPIDLVGLKDITSYERREYTFSLRVRNPNPKTAETLANLWANEANRQLGDAYSHAIKAQTLRRYLNTLVDCVSQAPDVPPAANLCRLSSLADVQTQIQTTNTELTNEMVASRGIIPAVGFQLTSTATLPTVPIRMGSNSLILAGGLIGFILGIWAVQVRLPVRLARSLRHA